MSKVIGITGGVGCGKSTVLKLLQEKLDAFVIEADKVGHIVMKKGMPAYYKVVNLFGNDVVDNSGEIDRQKIAEKIFYNKELLSKQKEFCDKYPNEYNIGVYNGLAIGLSVLTGEEPVFYEVKKEENNHAEG